MSAQLIAATAVAIDLMNTAVRVNQIIQRAQMEGRELTKEDWALLDADSRAAFARLDKAIAAVPK